MAKNESAEDRKRGYMYGMESMKWYGWGSAVGLSCVIVAIGLFLWLLHLANIIH